MMNARLVPVALVTVLGLVAVTGCKREEHSSDLGRTTTTTGANVGSTSNETALDRIVASRCAREATCNNVGTDKQFQNPAGCTAKIRSDMKDDLNAKDCPYGVDAKELNECLDAIRAESCSSPLDTITRLGACRTSDMCLKTAAPNR